MSSTSQEPPLVPLRLPSRAQWVLHHVLATRIERERRSPDLTNPLPNDVVHALEKVESGSLLFTPDELHLAREELIEHLARDDLDPGERRDVREAIERIDDAATGHSPPTRR